MFLSKLFIDEDGTVLDTNPYTTVKTDDGEPQVRDTVGDDLDYVFPPLDGTAMYSTTCKMNHSCDPNVVVLYKRSGYGSQHPLTAFCVALRDIAEGDELTISYIDQDRTSYAERQQALSYYGFVCTCRKCEHDAAADAAQEVPTETTAPSASDPLSSVYDELFGVPDEDTAKLKDDGATNLSVTEAEEALQRVLDRLDTISNRSRFGATLPMEVRVTIDCMGESRLPRIKDPTVSSLLSKCLNGVRYLDYCMCSIAGCDLERVLFNLLQQEGRWTHESLQVAYWCAVVTGAIGLTHECRFLEAMTLLDKSMVLGLRRSQNCNVSDFVDYVEYHAAHMARSPFPPAISAIVANYGQDDWRDRILSQGLAKPIQHPIEELSESLCFDTFHAVHITNPINPLLLRSYASKWQALDELRDFQHVAHLHGHRALPIELGSMLSGRMREALVTLRQFVDDYLVPSTEHGGWTLDDARNTHLRSRVAYMAQHALLSQIPSLEKVIPPQLELCGPSGPLHINVWIGTGGTRTPLHYDSYDNVLIQLVGIKYVRVYNINQSTKLPLLSDASYGKQGNMSSFNCEVEEDDVVNGAEYTEAVLFPGDALFIPCRAWHYVRSLTTSISVNYWFDA